MRIKKYNWAAFDVGNVLATFDMAGFLDQLNRCTLFKFSYEFLERIQHSNDLGLTNLGKEFASHGGPAYKYLVDHWCDAIEFHPQMVELIQRLKMKYGISIIFVSNMGEEHLKKLRLNQEMFSKMDVDVIQHFSCEVGARKPQKIFYQSLIMDYPFLADSLGGRRSINNFYFIDDIQENLDAAHYFGFNPYQFNLKNAIQTGNLDLEISKLENELTVEE